jgi:hypothetical protein
VNPPTLIEIAPAFADELEALLLASPDGHLAGQVKSLAIVDRCGCGQADCSTFYPEPRPSGAYGPDHETLLLDVEQGWVALDVQAGRIVCVEVLDRPDMFNALRAIKPSRAR